MIPSPRLAALPFAALPFAVLSSLPVDGAGERAAIPMYVSDDRILVMLRVGDHPPAPVVFDTGTSGNILDLAYAKHLGLPRLRPSTATDGTTGRAVEGYETSIAGARLGGVPIGDETASVLDYPIDDQVGIFGPNNFRGRLVTLDFARSRILIDPKGPTTTPRGTAIPYAEDGLPQIPLELAGKRIMATLDSGNDSPLLLPLAMAKTLPLRGPLVAIGQSVSAAGTQTTYRGYLRGKVRVGSIENRDPELLFVDKTVPNVGFPLIRRLRLTFDPGASRMWVGGAKPGATKLGATKLGAGRD